MHGYQVGGKNVEIATDGVNFKNDIKYLNYDLIVRITPEEFQSEFEKLGYVYDFETHTASKKRWRAEECCRYYFFSNLLEVKSDNDVYAGFDNVRYDVGNYFKTKEDAEAKVNEIKKLLKQ